jgi:hypothetical protein
MSLSVSLALVCPLGDRPSSSKTGTRQTHVTTVLLKITLITNTTNLDDTQILLNH